MNSFEPPKERDNEWVLNYLTKQKELFLEKVFELRSDKLKITKNDLENYLHSGVLNTEEAIKIGLMDGLHSVETLKYKNFKDSSIKNVKGEVAISKEFDVKHFV